jgi:hypothetical protein
MMGAVGPFNPSELRALYGTFGAIELSFAAFRLENQAEAAAQCRTNILKWSSANREPLNTFAIKRNRKIHFESIWY